MIVFFGNVYVTYTPNEHEMHFEFYRPKYTHGKKSIYFKDFPIYIQVFYDGKLFLLDITTRGLTNVPPIPKNFCVVSVGLKPESEITFLIRIPFNFFYTTFSEKKVPTCF